MRRFAIVCAVALSGCAAPPPRTAAAGHPAHTAPPSSGSEALSRATIKRFDGIARRHKRAADAYGPRADLSLPTTSIECEMERLRTVLTILGVMQANAQAIVAALAVSQSFEHAPQGTRDTSVAGAIEAYDRSVTILQRTVVDARRQERTFLDCVPLTLYTSAPL